MTFTATFMPPDLLEASRTSPEPPFPMLEALRISNKSSTSPKASRGGFPARYAHTPPLPRCDLNGAGTGLASAPRCKEASACRLRAFAAGAASTGAFAAGAAGGADAAVLVEYDKPLVV